MAYSATLNVYIYDAGGQVITTATAVADPSPRTYGSDPDPAGVNAQGLATFLLTGLVGTCFYDVEATCTGYIPESKRVTFLTSTVTKTVTFYLDTV